MSWEEIFFRVRSSLKCKFEEHFFYIFVLFFINLISTVCCFSIYRAKILWHKNELEKWNFHTTSHHSEILCVCTACILIFIQQYCVDVPRRELIIWKWLVYITIYCSFSNCICFYCKFLSQLNKITKNSVDFEFYY